MKKWFTSPWVITLVGTPLATLIYDWIKGVEIFSTISYLFFIVTSFFKIGIPIWVVVVMISLIFLLKKILNKPSKSLPTVNPNKIKISEYNEDTIFGWRWTWSYEWFDDRYMLQNITAYCPKCDSMMAYNELFRDYTCPRCNYFGSKQKSMRQIEQIIIDNIRRLQDSKP